MWNRLSIAVEDSNLKFILYYTKMSIEFCFKKITDLVYNESVNLEDSRYITAIAGPPGCGKSSIAQLFAHLFKRDYNVDTIILPLDGFHYENDYLKSQKINLKNRIVTLYDVKGAPETYNTDYYITCLNKLYRGEEFFWPIYSRKLHNPIKNGIKVSKNRAIYIIEGNYLLLNESPWNSLFNYYNRRIFINSRFRFLKKRIVKRKIAGGFSRKEAVKHFIISDRENIKRVLKNSTEYDILINQIGKYRYILKSF